MPRNGSGTYSLPGSSFQSGAVIEASAMNAKLSDLAQAMTGSLAKDGQTTPTANQAMGGFVHTNVGDASLRNQYAATGQVQDSAFLWGGTAGGTNTALTITLTPAPSAYAAGQQFAFRMASNSGGPATLNVNGIGAKSLVKYGATALATNDLASNAVVQVVYDGSNFNVVSPLLLSGSLTFEDITANSVTASSFDATSMRVSTLLVGSGDATGSPVAGSMRAADASGTDKTGAGLVIMAGNGTGTGGSGSITLKTASAGTTGSTANTMATRFVVDKSGAVQLGAASVASNYAAAGSVTAPATSAARFINTAKAWCRFNGVTTGTNAPTAGFNVTSIERTGTGAYTVNFTTDFADANYAVIGTARGSGGAQQMLISLPTAGTKTVSAVQINCMLANVGNSDSSEIMLVFYGN